MDNLVIYKLGETNLQTTITNGAADYTGGKVAEEYLDSLGPGYAILPFSQARKLIEKAEEKKYIAPWEEITEEEWDYWLGVLPPEKWKRLDEFEIFRISERMDSDITRHCVHHKGRYFTAFRRVSTDYKALAKEVNLAYQTID